MLTEKIARVREVARFASQYRGFYEKLDAAIRFIQFPEVEKGFDHLRLSKEERAEFRKMWLEKGIVTIFYRTCATCHVAFDPLFKPAEGHAPTTTLCGACVQAQQAPDDETAGLRQSFHVHEAVAAAARAARAAGWDLAKFQDESAAYFIGLHPLEGVPS
jgi:hypothetical protein